MTNKINGIDVATNNNNVYYSQKAVDELQNTIKRLQKENEELKTYIQKMDKPEIKTIDSEIALKNIELQEENEELKARLKTLDDEVLTIEITHDEFERYKKYEQALEEIRVFSENFCEDKCPFYENEYSEVCNEACLLDNIVNPILKKIDGVLNDRD